MILNKSNTKALKKLHSPVKADEHNCSVVLPAVCHLLWIMEVSEDDLAEMVKFNETFKAEMEKPKVTTLDPWFKNLNS
ncbi:hypothetical protein CRENBAI_019458 [Crenichthys baileyi]|uniref:Uncharacterized protein n=1 Tax=Crenichthys baileyi TaxID=28760 RepID=A0AAV9S498_9TELE